MPLAKWEPFSDLEKFFEEFPALRKQDMAGFVPAINVYTTEKNVVAEASLAGVDPEDIDVSVENDVLNIKGESEKESEVEEKDYFRKEVRSGSFYRSVTLPAHVQGEKAKASFENGILKVTVPKAPEAKKKTVKVKVNGEKKKKSKAKKTSKKK